MPASAVVRRAVAAEVNRLLASGLLIEAGSGWGTLAFQLNKHCKGLRIIGLENSLVPLLAARLMRLLMGMRSRKRLSFLRQNIYSYSFQHADAIVCYLYPGAMKRLASQWSKQCKPGAYIVSVCFALPGWKPEKELVCRDMHRTRIYVYRMAEQPPSYEELLAQTAGK